MPWKVLLAGTIAETDTCAGLETNLIEVRSLRIVGFPQMGASGSVRHPVARKRRRNPSSGVHR